VPQPADETHEEAGAIRAESGSTLKGRRVLQFRHQPAESKRSAASRGRELPTTPGSRWSTGSASGYTAARPCRKSAVRAATNFILSSPPLAAGLSLD